MKEYTQFFRSEDEDLLIDCSLSSSSSSISYQTLFSEEEELLSVSSLSSTNEYLNLEC